MSERHSGPLHTKSLDMSIRWKEEEMFSLIGQWEESDEDRATFCKKRGLTVATFSYWRTKYLKSQKSNTPQGFVELKPLSRMPVEIVYPNGVIIRLPSSSSASDLKALIQLV